MMLNKFSFAATVGVLASAAVAFVALPLSSMDASAAMKKKTPAKSAMKSSKMKGSAAPAAAGKGKTSDPLEPAAGKKM